MTKKLVTITLQVEPETMFDLIKEAQNSQAAYNAILAGIGLRFVDMCLSSGKVSLLDQVGLVFYGVYIGEKQEDEKG